MSHVVPDLVQKVLKGQDPLHILGDGSQVRHYTYGGDLARGIVTAMEHPAALNEDFNLSTAESHHRARAGRDDLAQDQGPDVPLRSSTTPPSSTTSRSACPCVDKAKRGARLRGDDDPERHARRGHPVDPLSRRIRDSLVQRGKADADYLSATYEARFSDVELRNKQVLWSVLCEAEFQKYVPENGTVLDLGAGYCEFVNVIHAARRIAVDLNPDTAGFAAEGVEVITTSSDDMSEVTDGTVDTVFTSNFFEHLPDTEALLRTLEECHRVLRPGGTIVVLMPNIRNLPGALLGLPRPPSGAHAAQPLRSIGAQWF